jgi:hypothetical protein
MNKEKEAIWKTHRERERERERESRFPMPCSWKHPQHFAVSHMSSYKKPMCTYPLQAGSKTAAHT